MQKLLYFFVFASVIVSTFCVINPEDYNMDVDESKVFCKAVNTKAVDQIKVDSLDNEMKYEDVLRLTAWNMKYNLKAGDYEFKFNSQKWRRPILNELFSIFKKGCNNDFVPHGFLNILKELIMIYYNSLDKKINPQIDRWTNVLRTLQACNNKTKPLDLKGMSLLIDTISFASEDVELLPPEELADTMGAVDLIIDNLWWIFSYSFGNCYSPAGYRSSWAPRYKKLFYEDFMVPFLSRWGDSGPHANFGVIFGNYDLEHVLTNIRMCVTGAYTALGIADRQLVRPIKFAGDSESDNLLPNLKTGNPFSK